MKERNERGVTIDSLRLDSFSFVVPAARLVVLKDIDRNLAVPILVSIGSDLLNNVVWTVDGTSGTLILQK